MIRRTSILAVLLSLLTLLLYLSPLAVAAEPDATKAFTLLNQDTSASADYDHLKDVIGAINTTPGNYTLTVNQDYTCTAEDAVQIKLVAGNTLTIQGKQGDKNDVLSAVAGKRHFDIAGINTDDVATVKLKDLTFDGKNVGGGFVLGKKIILEATNCSFTNNKAPNAEGKDFVRGSAIDAVEGKLTLTNCGFTQNEAKFGGALFSEGEVVLEGCNFEGNKAAQGLGGAIEYESSSATMEINNCTFKGNSADLYGGAIVQLYKGSTINIKNTQFEQNTAAGIGGAIFAQNGKLTIKGEPADAQKKNTNFFDNSAALLGGAIGVYGAEATIEGVKFTSNKTRGKSGSGGGAIYAQGILSTTPTSAVATGGTLTVTYSTFETNNSNSGGGIYSSLALTNVEHCDFRFNQAENKLPMGHPDFKKNGIGGGIYVTGFPKNQTGFSEDYKAQINVTDSTFEHNMAIGGGGLGVGFYNVTSATVSGQTKFDSNSGSAGGGAIYINPGVEGSKISESATPNAYKNVTIASTVEFKENKANLWFIPPEDVDTLTNIQSASVTKINDWPEDIKPNILNNRDVNYIGRAVITYDSNLLHKGDGKSLIVQEYAQSHEKGGDPYKIKGPEDLAPKMQKEGWKFLHWNLRSDGKEKNENGDKTVYVKDDELKQPLGAVHFYADWQVEVKFQVENGTPTTLDSQWVQAGKPMTAPTSEPKPTKEGDVFQGWYLGDELWDFGQPVMGPMTLVAKFAPKPVEPQDGNDNGDNDGNDNNANTNNGPGYWGYNPNLNHQPAQGNTQVVVPNQQGDQGQPQQAEKPAKSSLPATGAVDTTIPVLALMAIAVLMLRKGRA